MPARSAAPPTASSRPRRTCPIDSSWTAEYLPVQPTDQGPHRVAGRLPGGPAGRPTWRCSTSGVEFPVWGTPGREATVDDLISTHFFDPQLVRWREVYDKARETSPRTRSRRTRRSRRSSRTSSQLQVRREGRLLARHRRPAAVVLPGRQARLLPDVRGHDDRDAAACSASRPGSARASPRARATSAAAPTSSPTATRTRGSRCGSRSSAGCRSSRRRRASCRSTTRRRRRTSPTPPPSRSPAWPGSTRHVSSSWRSWPARRAASSGAPLGGGRGPREGGGGVGAVVGKDWHPGFVSWLLLIAGGGAGRCWSCAKRLRSVVPYLRKGPHEIAGAVRRDLEAYVRDQGVPQAVVTLTPDEFSRMLHREFGVDAAGWARLQSRARYGPDGRARVRRGARRAQRGAGREAGPAAVARPDGTRPRRDPSALPPPLGAVLP